MIPIRDTVPSRRFPIMNLLIIATNVLVFVLEASLGPGRLEPFVTRFGVIPARFLANPANPGQLFTLLSSMFLHGGWVHLVSNMWGLFIFGDNIEDRMGSWRYLCFYLLSGLAAAAVHILVEPRSALPVVGASGAISGVMGAYIVLFPRAKVITLIPLGFLPWFVQIPALLYLGFWFASQLLNGLLTLATSSAMEMYGGVAWWAHVGGFVMGLLLVKILEDRRTFTRWHPDEYRPW